MSDFHCIDPGDLERFLARQRAVEPFPAEMSLAENLVAVLRKASEFVPAEAGSILLDDPVTKSSDRSRNALTFIAAFGDRAEAVTGRRIRASDGVAGHVYFTGRSYRTSRLEGDESLFYPGVDALIDYETHSLVAIPIRLEQEVCGVLELVNRRERTEFTEQDLNLLEIFAGYISISIQNVLDGRLAQEIATRDNLTGLFNDRSLHMRLSQIVEQCSRDGSDLSVLFIDLDYFKRINDTHGHLAGSQVLREIGGLLGEITHPRGAIGARYGGDEFVIAAPGLTVEDAIDLAETIRTEIADGVFCRAPGEIQPEPLDLSGITCSIGVASLRRHVPDPMTPEKAKSMLLRLADSAMYVAKETGRNRTAVAGEPVVRKRRLDTPLPL